MSEMPHPLTADGSWRENKFVVERRHPLPLGPTERTRGINFAPFSKHSTAATLVLFRSGVENPIAEIPLDPHLNRTGHIWHILVRTDPSIRYGWRLDGPFDPGRGHRFDADLVLLDPHAQAITGGAIWGEPEIRRKGDRAPGDASAPPRRCCLAPQDFDWENDAPPRIPMEDTVIYELHVRGYTVGTSADVNHPGTYLGLAEKIPYLQKLGVTAVELMPVFEFDENEHLRHHPESGELLRNFWGYSPIAFFAPNASYAVDGRDGNQVDEFREMVKRFHRAGLEVFLDVVFNHTAESDERGPTFSFRGIDNSVYYLLDERGQYRNFSGCGNTLNCNEPVIREMILDCLRYWVGEMHVDGFRFDLASILGRAPDGTLLEEPPLIERIARDPVLADAKIIAEAWDAAGLNQVGRFPAYGRWAEWNGYFRDQLRLFWRGEPGMVSHVASRICGSDDLYKPADRKPYHSINFITAHDGFTMNDLVSYERKHNQDNGEDNRDGEEYNHSANYGVEGPSDDPAIERIRERQIRNFCVSLLVSQGTPMLLGGDEFRRTQQGNNNAYCQDNEISWVDWTLADTHADLVRFVCALVAFRKRHHSLRRAKFFEQGSSAISWHGERSHQPDWSEEACWLAFLLDGNQAPGAPDSHIMVLLNASTEWRHFEIPDMGGDWRRVVDTSQASPEDIFEQEDEAPVVGRYHDRYGVPDRTAVVLVAPTH